jgi:large subunit ribosomal protein L18
VTLGYVPLLRRRREGLTDYRARKKAIISQKPLLVVRFSNQHASAQFVKPAAGGDLVIVSAHSKELARAGWLGSAKTTPACYLLGLLAGKRAKLKGISEAVAYNGLVPFVKGGRMAAFLKGVADAGVRVPVDAEVFPSDDRLTGKAAAAYAAKLSADDQGAYKRTYSGLIAAGVKPEDYPEHFSKAKKSIMGEGK